MAQIIIDDLSSQFGYGGGNWTTVAASHFYGGSATWPDFAEGPNGDSGSYGLLTFNFQGMWYPIHRDISDAYRIYHPSRNLYSILWKHATIELFPMVLFFY